jgi:late competence protein required for DNA uptake (superfamily II DNA/RNA helicase)
LNKSFDNRVNKRKKLRKGVTETYCRDVIKEKRWSADQELYSTILGEGMVTVLISTTYTEPGVTTASQHTNSTGQSREMKRK